MGIMKKMVAATATDDSEIDTGLSKEVKDALVAITKIRSEARGLFLEREAEIDGLLTALIAQEHVLFLGPPGTAKSAMTESICGAINGSSYFQWLMTKFSVPEEVFGPISLKSLENDQVKRIVDGKLPKANVSFLDEINWV